MLHHKLELQEFKAVIKEAKQVDKEELLCYVAAIYTMVDILSDSQFWETGAKSSTKQATEHTYE